MNDLIKTQENENGELSISAVCSIFKEN